MWAESKLNALGKSNLSFPEDTRPPKCHWKFYNYCVYCTPVFLKYFYSKTHTRLYRSLKQGKEGEKKNQKQTPWIYPKIPPGSSCGILFGISSSSNTLWQETTLDLSHISPKKKMQYNWNVLPGGGREWRDGVHRSILAICSSVKKKECNPIAVSHFLNRPGKLCNLLNPAHEHLHDNLPQIKLN